MSAAVVKENHMDYNGKKYFRVGSEDVLLASYGEKKSPILQGNYLEAQSTVRSSRLRVTEAVEVDIDFERSSEKDVLANISLAGVFKGAAGTAYRDLRSARLRLVKLRIDNENLKDAVNATPAALDDLIGYGDDARVSNQVFIVLDAELAESFTTGTSFDLTVNVGVVKVTARNGNGASGSSTVTLSKGSVFAYGLVKAKWNATQKKKRTRVEKFTDDQWGPV